MLIHFRRVFGSHVARHREEVVFRHIIVAREAAPSAGPEKLASLSRRPTLIVPAWTRRAQSKQSERG
jgi:hypothetical protein